MAITIPGEVYGLAVNHDSLESDVAAQARCSPRMDHTIYGRARWRGIDDWAYRYVDSTGFHCRLHLARGRRMDYCGEADRRGGRVRGGTPTPDNGPGDSHRRSRPPPGFNH